MNGPCHCGSLHDEGLPPIYERNPELALAALLTLLTAFPARHTEAVAGAIVSHLKVVGGDARLDPLLRDCARSLLPKWEAFQLLSGAGAPAGVLAQ